MRSLCALLPLLFIALLSGGLQAQEQKAVGIYLKNQENLITELEQYLDANPEAADREAALLFLTNTLNALGRSKESLTRYEELFNLMWKRQSVSLTMVQSMVDLYAQTGQREAGLRLVNRLSGMFTDRMSDPEFSQFVYQMENQLRRPLVGESLEMEFTSLNGKEVSLQKMQGNVVLVHFWASEDPTSLAQLADLARLRREYGPRGLEIIGIALDYDRERLRQVIRDRNITWPQFCDGKSFDGKFADRYHIRSVPASYLIGKDGKILRTDAFGPQLEQLLADLLR